MTNACVIGFGNVGRATAELFGIDKYYDLKDSTITLEEAAKMKFVFICLPTPTINGQCYVDDIIETIREIAEASTEMPIFIIRSTVTPGTARYIIGEYHIPSIVTNPEFASEATMAEDIKHPPFILIGAQDSKYADEVRALYEGRIKGTRYIMTDTITAEAIKYTFNAFFSTKVAFANEIFDMCQRSGANYETIKEAIYTHPWGTKNHFEVWYKGKRGLGGACLPKDLATFAKYAQSDLLKEVKKICERLPDTPKY